MTFTGSRKSLLLVHAHPDDETINNGATMAMYVAAGFNVTLVTCRPPRRRRGLRSRNSLIVAADKERWPCRYSAKLSLANAMAALGVTDHRFLAPRHIDIAIAG
jgi:N-acetyl-1-D-myo-inositol-2-amino-2-deoxy-alpha-D-glucopyranoside deacetylase